MCKDELYHTHTRKFVYIYIYIHMYLHIYVCVYICVKMSYITHTHAKMSYVTHTHANLCCVSAKMPSTAKPMCVACMCAYVCVCACVCNITCLIHMCDTPLSCMRHVSFIRVTWLIHMCDMTHSHVSQDSCTCVAWLRCVCLQKNGLVRGTCTWDVSYVTCRMHVCHTMYWCAWQDSFICVTHAPHCHICHSFACVAWRFFLNRWNVTHSDAWQNEFLRVIWCIHMCDMTQSYVWHDSFIRVCSMSHSRVRQVAYIQPQKPSGGGV